MNNPYIELYDSIFKLSEELGFETYDHLPTDAASYPFVFLGEQFSDDKITKTRTMGKSNLIIHVFHHDYRRRAADKLLWELKKAIYEMKTTENFSWEVISSDTVTQYEQSAAGGNKLAHVILDITLEFQ